MATRFRRGPGSLAAIQPTGLFVEVPGLKTYGIGERVRRQVLVFALLIATLLLGWTSLSYVKLRATRYRMMWLLPKLSAQAFSLETALVGLVGVVIGSISGSLALQQLDLAYLGDVLRAVDLTLEVSIVANVPPEVVPDAWGRPQLRSRGLVDLVGDDGISVRLRFRGSKRSWPIDPVAVADRAQHRHIGERARRCAGAGARGSVAGHRHTPTIRLRIGSK